MAITGNASYISTINEFIAHWEQCNLALAPQSLLVRLPDSNTTLNYTQFVSLRDTLQSQQNVVQGCRISQQLARGDINLQKAALLAKFSEFTSLLDGYYRNTRYYIARPYAPSLGDGQEVFTHPMVDMMTLWEEMNAGIAPAGVTLPIILEDNVTDGAFASMVAALQFAYATERRKAQYVLLARSDRNLIQDRAYELMKTYRDAVPGKLIEFPALVETMPRLSPLPGHTPQQVNASAIFEAPNLSKVVYEASDDAMLDSYQLRGNAGEEYSEEDAVVVATRGPGEAREFVTTFGLTQPGAGVALKVFVILTTGNEAGSAVLLVQRPASVPLAA